MGECIPHRAEELWPPLPARCCQDEDLCPDGCACRPPVTFRASKKITCLLVYKIIDIYDAHPEDPSIVPVTNGAQAGQGKGLLPEPQAIPHLIIDEPSGRRALTMFCSACPGPRIMLDSGTPSCFRSAACADDKRPPDAEAKNSDLPPCILTSASATVDMLKRAAGVARLCTSTAALRKAPEAASPSSASLAGGRRRGAAQ